MSLKCDVTVDMNNLFVANAGLTNATADSDRASRNSVPGRADMNTCLGGTPSIQATFGPCTFTVGGIVDVKFDELPHTIGPGPELYQDLILNGAGLTTSNASFFCLGLVPNTTAITLNDLTFGVKVTPPPGSVNGIDFQ